MQKPSNKRFNFNNNDLSHHMLPNSATLVGMCIMVISIVKSMTSDLANYFIDKGLAIDSFLFGLVSMTLITVIFSFEVI